MEYLILPIIQHISNGMPELMVVDEDYGQLEVVDDDGKLMYELTYPAVLVDLEQVDWSEIQGGEPVRRSTHQGALTYRLL